MKTNRSFIWRVSILFTFISIVGSASVCKPDLLVDNTFLKAFMGPDLVAVLVVVLTITFASVANIHLSISRMVATARDSKAAALAASGVRSQINSNAWTIFWAFVVALVALIVYGQFPENETIRSFATATCLTVVMLNGLVMHDIYRTIFILVMNSSPTSNDDTDQDYSQGA